jgi:transposase
LGLSAATIEAVEFDEVAEAVVVSVRVHKKARRRCGRCGRRGSWYDRGHGRRRWRALDAGTMRVFVEADAPRVSCAVHGPTVVQVPWARHDAGHTRAFDDTVAWLAVHTSKSAVTELMRIAWRTVGAVLGRVQADIDASVDRFAGLRRIGIDEISYKRQHKFLTVVVDHDSGRLVWAAPGRDDKTLHGFFDLLGEARCAAITHVSADAADWIKRVVTARCPNATRCADPFHVVRWATEALDLIRRRAWNQARGGRPEHTNIQRRLTYPKKAHRLKRVRYALLKNPENLTDNQRASLDWIAKTDPQVHRAYLLKEGLRLVFALDEPDDAKHTLDRWIQWARRSRLPEFVAVQRRVVNNRAEIDAALDHQLSNALVESTNTKIRLLTRIAYGFRSADALIALALLALGGHTPTLPHRT